MRQYFGTLWAWLTGFAHLREVAYKPGFSAGHFWPLYLVDYGISCVFFANGVVSLSRAWKLLGKDHWMHTGMWLFGTSKCPHYVRLLVPAFWLAVLLTVARYLHWIG